MGSEFGANRPLKLTMTGARNRFIRIPTENRAFVREGEAPAEPVRESRVLSDPARQEPRPPQQSAQLLIGIRIRKEFQRLFGCR